MVFGIDFYNNLLTSQDPKILDPFSNCCVQRVVTSSIKREHMILLPKRKTLELLSRPCQFIFKTIQSTSLPWSSQIVLNLSFLCYLQNYRVKAITNKLTHLESLLQILQVCGLSNRFSSWIIETLYEN
jgi:hypothetical protein